MKPNIISRSNLIIIFLLCSFQLTYAQKPVLRLPTGHSGRVKSICFSPDNKNVVTVSVTSAFIWDCRTGRLLHELVGHSNYINTVDYSPDGKRIVTSSHDNTAKIWESSSGKLLNTLSGHTDYVNSAKYSPDGKTIVTSSIDNSAKIWDCSTGKLLNTITDHTSSVNSAMFSPDGKLLVTASDDNTAKIWDYYSGNLLSTLFCDYDVTMANFSPNGMYLLTSSMSVLTLWSVGSFQKVYSLWMHYNYPIDRVHFSPDSRYILTSYYENMSVLNVINGKKRFSLDGNLATFSPNGKYIATISYQGYDSILSDSTTISIWECNSGLLINRTIFKDNGGVESIQYSPDGNYIITGHGDLDPKARIWESPSAKLIHTLEGKISPLRYSEYLLGGKFLATSSCNYRTKISEEECKVLKIWDCSSGELFHNFSAVNSFPSAIISQNEIYIMLVSNEKAEIYENSTGKLLHVLKDHKDNIWSSTFSHNSKLVATASRDSSAILWDIQTGKKIVEIKHDGIICSIIFSPDDKYILTSSFDNTAKVWSCISGKLIKSLEGHSENVRSAFYSPNGKLIATSSDDNTTKVWESKTGKCLFTLKGNGDGSKSDCFSPDGKHVITSVFDTAMIWESTTGKLINVLNGHSSWFMDISKFSPDSKYVITSPQDGTAMLWDVLSGKKLITIDLEGGLAYGINWKDSMIFSSNNSMLSFYNIFTGGGEYSFSSIDSNGYIWLLSNGYYMADKNSIAKLYYVIGLQTLGFDQLDIKYNRPDIVLNTLGNIYGKKDTNLIKSYYRAYSKRIKKLNIDTSSFENGFSIPESKFLNRNDIDYDQTQSTIKLHISGIDSIYFLDRFNVWINDVPVFGQKGVFLRNQRSYSFDTLISVELSVGENKIETSVTNVNGTESYRLPLVVQNTQQQSVNDKVYFIGIGLDDYLDNRYNLTWSVKDIRDFCAALKDHYGDMLVVDTFFNENATLSNIKALKKKLLNTTVNDKVIMSFSGHGILSAELDYYLSTFNVDFNNPQFTGLIYEDIEDLLDSIPARKKLLLIDACHSGEIDKEEILNISQISDSISFRNFNASKGAYLVSNSINKIGLGNSFSIMQELFVNVQKGTGTTVISAAGGDQYALESDNLQNGIFTFVILDYLCNHPFVTVNELKNHVIIEVEKLSGGLQKPTTRGGDIDVDWYVW
jgi:WD40 repeat protein